MMLHISNMLQVDGVDDDTDSGCRQTPGTAMDGIGVDGEGREQFHYYNRNKICAFGRESGTAENTCAETIVREKVKKEGVGISFEQSENNGMGLNYNAVKTARKPNNGINDNDGFNVRIENCYSMRQMTLRQMMDRFEKNHNQPSVLRPGTREYFREQVLYDAMRKHHVRGIHKDIDPNFYKSLISPHITAKDAFCLQKDIRTVLKARSIMEKQICRQSGLSDYYKTVISDIEASKQRGDILPKRYEIKTTQTSVQSNVCVSNRKQTGEESKEQDKLTAAPENLLPQQTVVNSIPVCPLCGHNFQSIFDIPEHLMTCQIVHQSRQEKNVNAKNVRVHQNVRKARRENWTFGGVPKSLPEIRSADDKVCFSKQHITKMKGHEQIGAETAKVQDIENSRELEAEKIRRAFTLRKETVNSSFEAKDTQNKLRTSKFGENLFANHFMSDVMQNSNSCSVGQISPRETPLANQKDKNNVKEDEHHLAEDVQIKVEVEDISESEGIERHLDAVESNFYQAHEIKVEVDGDGEYNILQSSVDGNEYAIEKGQDSVASVALKKKQQPKVVKETRTKDELAMHLQKCYLMSLSRIQNEKTNKNKDDFSSGKTCHLCSVTATGLEFWVHYVVQHVDWKRVYEEKSGTPGYGPYFCSHCLNDGFVKVAEVQMHERRVHMSSFPCYFCGLSCSTLVTCLNHVADAHGLLYRCKDCQGEYYSKFDFTLHFDKCDQSKKLVNDKTHDCPYFCPYCLVKRFDKGGLKRHLKYDHYYKKTKYPNEKICFSCKLSFLDEEAVAFHQSSQALDSSCNTHVTLKRLKTIPKTDEQMLPKSSTVKDAKGNIYRYSPAQFAEFLDMDSVGEAEANLVIELLLTQVMRDYPKFLTQFYTVSPELKRILKVYSRSNKFSKCLRDLGLKELPSSCQLMKLQNDLKRYFPLWSVQQKIIADSLSAAWPTSTVVSSETVPDIITCPDRFKLLSDNLNGTSTSGMHHDKTDISTQEQVCPEAAENDIEAEACLKNEENKKMVDGTGHLECESKNTEKDKKPWRKLEHKGSTVRGKQKLIAPNPLQGNSQTQRNIQGFGSVQQPTHTIIINNQHGGNNTIILGNATDQQLATVSSNNHSFPVTTSTNQSAGTSVSQSFPLFSTGTYQNIVLGMQNSFIQPPSQNFIFANPAIAVNQPSFVWTPVINQSQMDQPSLPPTVQIIPANQLAGIVPQKSKVNNETEAEQTDKQTSVFGTCTSELNAVNTKDKQISSKVTTELSKPGDAEQNVDDLQQKVKCYSRLKQTESKNTAYQKPHSLLRRNRRHSKPRLFLTNLTKYKTIAPKVFQKPKFKKMSSKYAILLPKTDVIDSANVSETNENKDEQPDNGVALAVKDIIFERTSVVSDELFTKNSTGAAKIHNKGNDNFSEQELAEKIHNKGIDNFSEQELDTENKAKTFCGKRKERPDHKTLPKGSKSQKAKVSKSIQFTERSLRERKKVTMYVDDMCDFDSDVSGHEIMSETLESDAESTSPPKKKKKGKYSKTYYKDEEWKPYTQELVYNCCEIGDVEENSEDSIENEEKSYDGCDDFESENRESEIHNQIKELRQIKIKERKKEAKENIKIKHDVEADRKPQNTVSQNGGKLPMCYVKLIRNREADCLAKQLKKKTNPDIAEGYQGIYVNNLSGLKSISSLRFDPQIKQNETVVQQNVNVGKEKCLKNSSDDEPDLSVKKRGCPERCFRVDGVHTDILFGIAPDKDEKYKAKSEYKSHLSDPTSRKRRFPEQLLKAGNPPALISKSAIEIKERQQETNDNELNRPHQPLIIVSEVRGNAVQQPEEMIEQGNADGILKVKNQVKSRQCVKANTETKNVKMGKKVFTNVHSSKEQIDVDFEETETSNSESTNVVCKRNLRERKKLTKYTFDDYDIESDESDFTEEALDEETFFESGGLKEKFDIIQNHESKAIFECQTKEGVQTEKLESSSLPSSILISTPSISTNVGVISKMNTSVLMSTSSHQDLVVSASCQVSSYSTCHLKNQRPETFLHQKHQINLFPQQTTNIGSPQSQQTYDPNTLTGSNINGECQKQTILKQANELGNQLLKHSTNISREEQGMPPGNSISNKVDKYWIHEQEKNGNEIVYQPMLTIKQENTTDISTEEKTNILFQSDLQDLAVNHNRSIHEPTPVPVSVVNTLSQPNNIKKDNNILHIASSFHTFLQTQEREKDEPKEVSNSSITIQQQQQNLGFNQKSIEQYKGFFPNPTSVQTVPSKNNRTTKISHFDTRIVRYPIVFEQPVSNQTVQQKAYLIPKPKVIQKKQEVEHILKQKKLASQSLIFIQPQSQQSPVSPNQDQKQTLLPAQFMIGSHQSNTQQQNQVKIQCRPQNTTIKSLLEKKQAYVQSHPQNATIKSPEHKSGQPVESIILKQLQLSPGSTSTKSQQTSVSMQPPISVLSSIHQQDLIQSDTGLLQQSTTGSLQQSATGSLQQTTTGSLQQSATGLLQQSTTGLLQQSATGLLQQSTTGSLQQSATGSLQQSTTGSLQQSATGLLQQSTTGSLQQSATGLLQQSTTGSLQQSATGSLQQSSTGSLQQSATGSLQQSTTGSLQQSATGSLQQSATESLQQSTTGSLQQSTTGSLQQSTTGSLQQSTTGSLHQSTTESLQQSATESLQQSTTGSLHQSTTESLQQSTTGLLQQSATGSLQQSASESIQQSTTGSLHQSTTGSLQQSTTGSLQQSAAELFPTSTKLKTIKQEIVESIQPQSQTIPSTVSTADVPLQILQISPGLLQNKCQILDPTAAAAIKVPNTTTSNSLKQQIVQCNPLLMQQVIMSPGSMVSDQNTPMIVHQPQTFIAPNFCQPLILGSQPFNLQVQQPPQGLQLQAQVQLQQTLGQQLQLQGQQIQPQRTLQLSIQQQPKGQQLQPSIQQKRNVPHLQPSVQQHPQGQQLKPSIQQHPQGQQLKPLTQQHPQGQQLQPSIQQHPQGQQLQPSIQQHPQGQHSFPQQQPLIQPNFVLQQPQTIISSGCPQQVFLLPGNLGVGGASSVFIGNPSGVPSSKQ